MRHGGQEGTPDLLRLPIHLGLCGDPEQSIPLQHEGELVAECTQDSALRGGERSFRLEQEQADDPAADVSGIRSGVLLPEPASRPDLELARRGSDRGLFAQLS